jgi:hypothetical protein
MKKLKRILYSWLEVTPNRVVEFMQDELDDQKDEIIWQNAVIEALKDNNRELTAAVNQIDLGTF